MHKNVDIDIELASYLEEKLVRSSPMSVQSCIFKVPAILRRYNEHLFYPNFVSIGPYHRHQEKLQPMEKVKLWYLDCLIARAPTPETNLGCFIKSIRANVKHCYECYAEKVTMKTDEFVEMMVVDGCFIVELFRRWANMVPTTADDPLFKMSWMRKVLVLDLLLLENQLPWFVLDCFFNLTKSSCHNNSNECSLPQLAHNCLFWDTLRCKPIQVDSSLQIRHLLDLQRSLIVSGNIETTRGFPLTPCVNELLQAGVDFEMGQDGDLMKIEFKNGIIIIPPMVIVDNGESFLRNLIAYEQCDSSLKDKFTAYAAFFDNLIDSAEDIDYLRQKGIINCFLSTEDVSGFFKRLYKDAHVSYSPYRDLSQKINDYYESPWPRWRATLSRDYFSNPWSFISLIAGIIVLALTFLQTIYSML